MGLWPKYMTDDVVGVLVFLDASNRCQVPEVLVDLVSVIKHDRFGLLVRYSMRLIKSLSHMDTSKSCALHKLLTMLYLIGCLECTIG
jgi:hypothetical protein